jgi:hypothetical protein
MQTGGSAPDWSVCSRNPDNYPNIKMPESIRKLCASFDLARGAAREVKP